MDREANMLTYQQSDRWADKQLKKEMWELSNRLTEEQTDKQRNRQIDTWRNRQTNRGTGRRETEKRIDGQTDNSLIIRNYKINGLN